MKSSHDYKRGPPGACGLPPTAAPGAEDELEGLDAPWQGEPEVRSAIVPAALHGQRLDKAVVDLAGEFSRTHLQGLIADGHVRLDGTTASSASRKVGAGQVLRVELVPTAQSRAFRAEAMALDIVHEDDAVIVLVKPAGRVVHPAAGNWSGTLLNGLLAHHAAAATLPRAGIVHRLDKDTSGLMVVGKTLAAVTALVRMIAARSVSRRYLAIAHGTVRPAAFSVEAPIARDPASRIRMAVVPGGKPARTDFRVVDAGAACSALECTLHTGRTHQIRVHLASHGHPLVGDTVYGGRAVLGLARQALHAHRLAFEHPATGRPLAFEAAPPDDLRAALAAIADASRTADA